MWSNKSFKVKRKSVFCTTNRFLRNKSFFAQQIVFCAKTRFSYKYLLICGAKNYFWRKKHLWCKKRFEVQKTRPVPELTEEPE